MVDLNTTRGKTIRQKSTLAGVLIAAAVLLPGGAALAADCEGPAGKSQLTVRVTGVPAARGEMAVTIYPDDRRRFLASGGRLLRVRPAATAPVTTTCFNLPGPGFYAVAIYHDANADRDFNRTIIGLPAEDYGFSNNPQNLTGLPSFSSVRFRVDPGDNTIAITLQRARR